MGIDWGAYPYGAHYAAYLNHLMHCAECGPTRLVGRWARTCAPATSPTPDTHGTAPSVPGPGAEPR
ncbi:hypothetical protein BZZ08_00574 [Streptomyces sp. MH60]|nr:hypothetical protein BZZ08_00574 [Streptomyces sp. MH60]